jgi:uncharacterized protein YmfQ (DUF2313 family)
MSNPSFEAHVKSIADYMPNGKLFESKNIYSSNFHQLLRGIAGELFTAQGYLATLEDEYIPDATNLFLSEWESALGIPDSCFSGEGTNVNRRRDILVKLAASGIQTAEDFIALGELFGVAITVSSGVEVASFPISFPIIYFASPIDSRYTLAVNFPLPSSGFYIYSFPIVFGDESQSILRCLFSKLRPSNCQILFRSAA